MIHNTIRKIFLYNIFTEIEINKDNIKKNNIFNLKNKKENF
jgi:hypothetical protein